MKSPCDIRKRPSAKWIGYIWFPKPMNDVHNSTMTSKFEDFFLARGYLILYTIHTIYYIRFQSSKPGPYPWEQGVCLKQRSYPHSLPPINPRLTEDQWSFVFVPFLQQNILFDFFFFTIGLSLSSSKIFMVANELFMFVWLQKHASIPPSWRSVRVAKILSMKKNKLQSSARFSTRLVLHAKSAGRNWRCRPSTKTTRSPTAASKWDMVTIINTDLPGYLGQRALEKMDSEHKEIKGVQRVFGRFCVKEYWEITLLCLWFLSPRRRLRRW